ncbi:MAG: hypothetical protein ACRCY4_05145 [Brevinema sp.]
MKKISFLSLFLVVVATTAWAQDAAAPKQSRNLSIYTDFSSGHLASGLVTAKGKTEVVDTNQVFEGNEVEWGIRYSQNFKNAPMVTMGGTINFVANYLPVYNDNGLFSGTPSSGNPTSSNDITLKSSFWVSVPYFMILIDTRGLMGLYLNHSFNFGNAGSFSMGFDLEFFYTGNPFYGNRDGDGNSRVPGTVGPNGDPISPNYVVDYVGFWLGYGVSLGKGFYYNMGLQFRLGGSELGGVEADAGAGFNIRWNNTFGYSVDGWNFYLQFRLDGKNLATPNTAVLRAFDKDPNAQFQIISGLSYTFDLAIAK